MNTQNGHRITLTPDMIASLNLPRLGASKEQEDATIQISRALISCLSNAERHGKAAAAHAACEALWLNVKNEQGGTERLQLIDEDFMKFLNEAETIAAKEDIFQHAFSSARLLARDLFSPAPSYVHALMTSDGNCHEVVTNLSLSDQERALVEATALNIARSQNTLLTQPQTPGHDNAASRSMQVALERMGCAVSLYKDVGDIELNETALKKIGIFCTGISPHISAMRRIITDKLNDIDERIEKGERCIISATDGLDTVVFDEDLPGLTTQDDARRSLDEEGREDSLFRQSMIDLLTDYRRAAEDTEDQYRDELREDFTDKTEELLTSIYEVKPYIKLSFCTKTGDLLDEQGNLHDFNEAQQELCAKKSLALLTACLPPDKKEALLAIRGWDMDNRALAEIAPDLQVSKSTPSPTSSFSP